MQHVAPVIEDMTAPTPPARAKPVAPGEGERDLLRNGDRPRYLIGLRPKGVPSIFQAGSSGILSQVSAVATPSTM